MFITPSFKKSLIVEQFQGNYLNTINVAGRNTQDTMTLRYKQRFVKGFQSFHRIGNPCGLPLKALLKPGFREYETPLETL